MTQPNVDEKALDKMVETDIDHATEQKHYNLKAAIAIQAELISEILLTLKALECENNALKKVVSQC